MPLITAGVVNTRFRKNANEGIISVSGKIVGEWVFRDHQIFYEDNRGSITANDMERILPLLRNIEQYFALKEHFS